MTDESFLSRESPSASSPVDRATDVEVPVVDGISAPPAEGDRVLRRAAGVRERLVNLRRLSFLRFGLAGQVLTFAAMLVPILLHDGRAISVLVFTAAIAIALSPGSLLGYQFVYPVIRGPQAAAAATRAAALALTAVSLALLPLTLVERSLGVPGGSFAAAATLLFTNGLYAIALTQLVRDADTRGIGLIRLGYGGAMLALTCAAVWWVSTPLGLTFAAALAYLFPAMYFLLRRRARVPAVRRLPARSRRRLFRAYLRRSVRPTFSSLANGWAYFLPGIALPGLGVAAEPWAIVARICGGFSTVLQTIVAPPLEARMAGAVRDRNRSAYTRARRTALLVGAALSILAIGTGLGLAVYENSSSLSLWLAPLSAATVLFFGVLLASTAINRTPNFVGRDTARLIWDVARAACVTVAFVSTGGVTRLIVIGIVLTLFGFLLLPLTRFRAAVPARPV